MKTRRLPFVIFSTLAAAAWAADKPVAEIRQIPIQRGLVMVSALHSPQGDRENVVTIEQHDATGVTFGFNMEQRGADGKVELLAFHRFVRAVDLEKASRLHNVYRTADKTDYPGYTGWSLSTAIYDAIAAGGEVPYMIVNPARAQADPGEVVERLSLPTKRSKGTLRLVAGEPRPFPVLYNGARVTVPTIRARGKFVADGVTEDVELWTLADRQHPLLLKSRMGSSEWQMVRIETPQAAPVRSLEQQLARTCRVEIPGVYFAFATASLDPQSDRALGAVAQMLREHADWSVSIEGHTDGIGSDAANVKLSQARADAVRASLTTRHSIPAGRLEATGFGEARPREPNDTLEGRARNRRVELVRPCAASS